MLRNRSVAVLCLALTAGLAAGLFLHFALVLFIIALCWGVLMLVRPARKMRFALTVAIVVFGIGSVWGLLYSFFSTLPETPKGETAAFTASIKDIQEVNGRYRATVDVDDDCSEYDGYSAYMYLGERLSVGDIIQVNATMRATAPSIRGIGIEYNAYGSAVKQDGVYAKGIFYTAAKLRHGINARIHDALDDDAAGFYGALITGVRQGMSEEADALFSRSGLSHIIAISGQHFSVIVMSLYTLLLLTMRRKKFCCGLCIVIAIAYTVLVGASPSVVRACIMCCAVFLSWMSVSQTDSFTVLCIALAAIVMISPYSIASMGLQLSFLATAGILTVFELRAPDREQDFFGKIKELIVAPVITTVAASFFCLPVLLTSFDYISAVSPFANLAVNYLASPALIAGIACAAFADVLPQITLFTLIPEYIYSAIVWIAEFSVSLPYSTVSSHLPYVKLMLVPTLWLVAATLVADWRIALRSVLGSVLATVLIVACCAGAYNLSLRRNAMLCVNEEGGYILCADGSDRLVVDMSGKDGCSDGVLKSGFTAIDKYVVTSADSTAMERLERTLYYINIDTVYLPKAEDGAFFELDFLDKVRQVVYYDRGLLEFSQVKLYVPERKGAVSAFILVAEHGGTSIEAVGARADYKDWHLDDVDGLILTEAFVERNMPEMMLPEGFDRLYVYGDHRSYYTDSLAERAEYRFGYEDGLTLRYGENGILEVN
ncbi:MAG: ComEC/Rec2 family competence protein [Clostridia bacterium]|nr:ComEC/Rec2 family competence protein [Clostridia bacterium]